MVYSITYIHENECLTWDEKSIERFEILHGKETYIWFATRRATVTGILFSFPAFVTKFPDYLLLADLVVIFIAATIKKSRCYEHTSHRCFVVKFRSRVSSIRFAFLARVQLRTPNFDLRLNLAFKESLVQYYTTFLKFFGCRSFTWNRKCRYRRKISSKTLPELVSTVSIGSCGRITQYHLDLSINQIDQNISFRFID